METTCAHGFPAHVCHEEQADEVRNLARFAHRHAYNWAHRLVGCSELPTYDDAEAFADWCAQDAARFGGLSGASYPVLLRSWR